MNKVYVVTSGEYSDYHIDAVFASREKAEAYIKAKNKAEWEEYEHDEWAVQTSYNIEEWNLGDDYVDINYWQVFISIDTSRAFEERSVDSQVWDNNGVDAYKAKHVFNTIQITSPRSYHDAGYVVLARYYVPKNRFTTKKEVKTHYEKVMRDLLAKIKYMYEIDGMTIKEVEDMMNVQLNEGTKGEIK